MQNLRVLLLIAAPLLGSCNSKSDTPAPVVTLTSDSRVYEHKSGTPWPKYRPDMTRQVVWIETTANAPGTIVDGEINGEPGSHGGNDYTTGGTVGFADGSSVKLSRIMVIYLDHDQIAVAGP